MQLIIFLPMALIRNLAKLSTTVLVADVFILTGLIYIFGSEFGFIAQRGIAKVELFNPKDFPLRKSALNNVVCVLFSYSRHFPLKV
jgi:proton-coupled amino acid transporter